MLQIDKYIVSHLHVYAYIDTYAYACTRAHIIKRDVYLLNDHFIDEERNE